MSDWFDDRRRFIETIEDERKVGGISALENSACLKCYKIFKSKQAFLSHMRSHESRSESELEPRPELRSEPRFESECGPRSELRSESEFEPRSELRSDPRSAAEFESRSEPASESRSESKSENRDRCPYRCQLCQISFEARGLLVAHTAAAHVNADGEYFCSKCSKNWQKPGPFREHLRYAHGDFKHECPNLECGKKFTRSDKLQQHLLAHTKMRPFICERCGRTFTRKDRLNKHFKLDNCAKDDRESERL